MGASCKSFKVTRLETLEESLRNNFVVEGQQRDPDEGFYKWSEFGRITFDDGRQEFGIVFGKEGHDVSDRLVCGPDVGEKARLAPILEVSFVPTTKGIFGQAFASIAESVDDLSIGDAVFEHRVDLFAYRVGEGCDFATATAFEREP